MSIRETDRSDRLDGGISSSSTVSSFLRVDILLRAKFVAYAVLEQVERFERAGAAPIPDQGTVPGEESARPGESNREVQRLQDVVARVRGELAVAEVECELPRPEGRGFLLHPPFY